MSARQIRVALRFSNGQRVEGMTTPGATIWETLQALCKQVSPNPNQPTADGGFSPMLAQTIERKTSGILLKTDERPQGMCYTIHMICFLFTSLHPSTLTSVKIPPLGLQIALLPPIFMSYMA